MRRSRIVLLVASIAVVAVVLGGGAVLRAGTGEGSYRQMLLFSEVLSYVVDNYVDPVDSDEIMNGAFDGMLNGIDAHSTYLTAAEVSAWSLTTETAPADTGVSVLKSGPVFQVVHVAEGSPAASAGIAEGDQIRKIAGRSVQALSLDQAVRLLGGPPGTTVALDVLRVKDFKRDLLVLARAARTDPAYRIDVTGRVAVLRVNDFGRLPNEALETELAAVKDRGVDRLLVDVRDAVSLETRRVVGVADLFLSGEVLRLEDRAGRTVETLGSKRVKPAWTGPLAVLVNGATAGPGEGLAVVLKDRLNATVYGEPTYGLGTEPKLIQLPEGGGLMVSGFVWSTPSGKRWNVDGIAPDKVIKSAAREAGGADGQLQKAIEEFTRVETAEVAAKAA